MREPRQGVLSSDPADYATLIFDLVVLISNKRGTIAIIFFDMAKAFLSPHELRLPKLEPFVLAGLLCSWLTFCFVNCSRGIGGNGTVSELQPVTSFIIEGSVLGPLLFMLYVSDTHGNTPWQLFYLLTRPASLEIRATCIAPKHVQQLAAFNPTERVIWPMGDAILCDWKRFSGIKPSHSTE